MISQQSLTTYLHQLLACDTFHDYAPNGIQVAGKKSIQTICTAVTASLDVIKQAVQLKADALLVHHGYFWKGEALVITGIKQARIAELIRHNVNLYAYHLPLDCHKELGNNAQLAHLLGMQSIKRHKAGNTCDLLWSGLFETAKTITEVMTLLTERLQRTPLHIAGSSKLIKHIAWCSGGAQDFIEQAHLIGVDAYISGEVSERTYYQARELGVHYFAAGHHATERYGIKALGHHLAEYAKIGHVFIDSDNPV